METSSKSGIELIVGPSSLFNMAEILDQTTLDVTIHRSEIISSQSRTGSKVRKIQLSFTSQNWHGFFWRHNVHVYVPIDYKESGNAAIIGTSRPFFDGEFKKRLTIPETGQGTEAEYAEGTAIDLGIPIMIIPIPGEDIGGMNEVDLMGYGDQMVMKTGDLTWYGYHALAMCFLRAITLLQALPEVKAKKTVLMGCSKRGYAITIASAVDKKRIAGIVTACFSGGNHLYGIAMKLAQFGHSVAGPNDADFGLEIDEGRRHLTGAGFQPAPMVLKGLNSPGGFRLLCAYDPYLWHDQIEVPFLLTLGTNDEFFALGACNEMMETYNGDKATLMVDNRPHTWVSDKHLLAWRMWLIHTFNGRSVPKLEVTGERNGESLTISADIEGTVTLDSVKLFYAFNSGSDWRFADWQSVPMKNQADVFYATIPIKQDIKIAYYVEVSDEEDNLVSSLVSIYGLYGHPLSVCQQ